MKKYLVIGNPIKHSLSPLIHNHWLKKYKIDAVYEKKEFKNEDLKELFSDIKKSKLEGINVTVPFKNEVIMYLENLTLEAEKTQSVNTVYLKNNKLTGHNTDIEGFRLAIRNINLNIEDKEIFILGAGGVVPSLIYALKKLKVSKIIVSNRTRDKAEKLKSIYQDLTIIDWGKLPRFDMVINATSLGLKNDDKIPLDFSKTINNKIFYDIIYNPRETNFLKNAKILGNKIENGKRMFLYQAALAFEIWHGIKPIVNDETIKLLD